MSKFCFLLLTFCAQLWPILCIMFLSFRKDQPCGAWAFCMFFCWHVTQPPNDYSSMAQPFQEPRHLPTHVLVHLPVFSILICGICQDAVSPTWPEAEVVHAVRTFLYWFNCHFSRETWFQQVCKIETNLAQPHCSCRIVSPLLEHQDNFWIVHVYCFASMHNVRQCLRLWLFAN